VPCPALLIIMGALGDGEPEQLPALAAAGWSVLVTAPFPSARWRFALSAGGHLDTGDLGLHVAHPGPWLGHPRP
jgi:hypothetical protein